MFIALDENKERVSIDNVDKAKQYFCPVCGEKLSIRAMDSLAIKPHFAHKKGTECLDNWKHDMSEWHYNWQCLFPKNCREIVVEKDGVKHRADVLINNVVIEIQHSPITANEITERNDFYLNSGYKVIWIFDAQDKVKNIYDVNGSVDPLHNELEWKRSRREFNIPPKKDVYVFIEYSTEIFTNPPQTTAIMVWLTKFDPKKIECYNTYPLYINRFNFLKEMGLNVRSNQPILSITEILKKHSDYRQKNASQQKHYIIPYKNRRKFRF